MATFTKRIDAGIRDIGYADTSAMESSASSLGYPGAVYRNLAYRFTDVTIPQGATITSAKVTFQSQWTESATIKVKIEGVDEDNTAEFVISPEDTARTRTKTTANVAWEATVSYNADTGYDSPNIGSIIQEIVDRGSWSSGNALALWFSDNGSTSGQYINMYEYGASTTKCALLTIEYQAASASVSISASPSATKSASPSSSESPSIGSSPSFTQSASSSATPSSSISASPSVSSSATPSSSISATKSASPSLSNSPSPSPINPFFGMKISKTGHNVLLTDTPGDLIFSSDYGTLKYLEKVSIATSLDANGGEIACTGTYTHDLGYYPYCEAYVEVYVGDTKTGVYEYCPFAGSGATIAYSASFKITTTQIKVYGLITGMSTSVWHFDFIFFLFKNNLLLS